MNFELSQIMDIIVGTAGHIDHGKTSLVRALTGVDADRLPEEKRRGITIDLGFAELDLGGVRVGFVDVPGHERFVKNMLAGAHGIDLVALVVAADEGVMPQTREHFDICRLLEVKSGLVVITKTDMVDEELLELVKLDVAELVENSFLENAPVLTVSARTGDGIENFKQTLREIAVKIPERKNETAARLPVDRSFSIKGFGAVVTGTLVAGEIAAGSEMQLMPAGKRVKVRGLQTHGKTVAAAHAGQRTAVNLGGIDHAEIERGMVLSEPDALRPTQIFDAEIEVLASAKKGLKSRQRVRVHLGAIEALARVRILNQSGETAPGEKNFAQFRLESEVATIPGERFIVRSYSPQITIAGGRVVDAHAVKHYRRDISETRRFLQNLIDAEGARDKTKTVRLFLETAGGERGLFFGELRSRTGWREEILRRALDENLEKKSIIEAGDQFYLARTPFENLKEKALAEIETHHRREPLSRGMLRETLRERVFAHLAPDVFKAVLASLEAEGKIMAEKDVVKIASYHQQLSPDEKNLRERLEKIYGEAHLAVPTLENALEQALQGTKLQRAQARKVFQLFLDGGEILKVTDEFYFTRRAIGELVEKLKTYAAQSSDRMIDVPTFKDIAGISRKHAIPLLEYFDRERVTRRAGDKRLIL